MISDEEKNVKSLDRLVIPIPEAVDFSPTNFLSVDTQVEDSGEPKVFVDDQELTTVVPAETTSGTRNGMCEVCITRLWKRSEVLKYFMIYRFREHVWTFSKMKILCKMQDNDIF